MNSVIVIKLCVALFMSSLVVFDFDETLIPVDSDRYVVQNLSGDRWPQLKQVLTEAAKQHQWTKGMDDAMAALHSFGVSEAQITGMYSVPQECVLIAVGRVSCTFRFR